MSLDTDNEGFLKDYTTWSESIAPVLAAAEGIELTAAHWEIIHAVRNYYAQYHISPMSRALSKVISAKLGEDKGKSIYLMQLFTPKPAKIIAKVSGLPKPPNCD